MHKVYFAGLLIMLCNLNSYSQTPVSTLQQLWKSAYATYPDLQAKQALILAASYQAQQQKRNQFPKIQLQLQQTYGTSAGNNGAFFPLPGIFNVSGNQVVNKATATGNAYGSVTADWNIFQFGKEKSLSRAAVKQTGQAQAELSISRLQIQTAVTGLFLQLLHSTAYADWAKRNSDRIRELKQITNSLALAGIKPGADTSLAASTLHQALALANEWDGKRDAAGYALKEYVPDFGSNHTLQQASFLDSPSEFSTSVDSLSTHPYVLALQQQAGYKQEMEKVAASKVLPSLSLLGGVSARGSGIQDQLVSNGFYSGYKNASQNYLVGLGITWNLSRIYTGSLDKKKINQQFIAAELEVKKQQLELNTGINVLNAQLNAQMKKVINTSAAVVQSEQAYRLYFTRYSNGLIDLTDLLQIQLLLQNAERSNIEAYSQLWDQFIARATAMDDFSVFSTHF
ncbi:TolC family protein [Pedobacter antarcticus]|uniref:TolC family protein n=1 Tax=Pedobacter antarcticus TaxID=34086 RepID=UPI0029317297|nr:TolC family protein [Pedobacter antarcticus]